MNDLHHFFMFICKNLILLIACFFPLLIQANSLKTPFKPVKTETFDKDSVNYPELLSIIEGQLASIRAHNIKKAYIEFSATEFKKITSEEQFTQFINDFSVFFDNKSFYFNSVNFEKSIATFEGSLISKKGEILEVEYDLIPERGKWKILGIQLFKPETTSLRPD